MERVRSIVFEMESDDGGVTVVLRLERSGLRVVCSCGAGGAGPSSHARCAHARSAMSLLPSNFDARGADVYVGAAQSTASGTPVPPSASHAARPEPIVAELRILIEALLRAAAGEVTTAVDEALRLATETLATRPLPGVARVLARVSSSLGARGSAVETALAITALGEVKSALEGAYGELVRAEVAGCGAEVAKLDEVELVEVARLRERVAICWETRLLVDPASGALYREEGVAGARSLSNGVCGRRVLSTLASKAQSCEPPRLQLMHYQLEPAASQDLMRRIAEGAPKSLAVPAEVRASPLLAVACPRVTLVAPESVTLEAGNMIIADAAGNTLALDRARDPGGFDALGDIVEAGGHVSALAGALQVDVDGVRFQPWSAIIERSRGLELVPLAV
jgi:hypothetical protein